VDLSQLLRAIRRRWYVMLPLTLLAIVVAFVVRAGVQPGYTVTASVIVLPPNAARVLTPQGVEIQSVNPLLNFNSSTQVAAQALAILATGPEFRKSAAGASKLATYTVIAPPREPILEILVESKSRSTALDVGGRVITELAAELGRQQPIQRPEEQLSIQTLAQPGVAEVDDAQLRALAVTLAIGLLLTLAITILVDAVATRRAKPSARRHASQTSTSTETAEEPGAAAASIRSRSDLPPGHSGPGVPQPASQ
jgi:capsular polysaccharide biosynthesis protein